MTLLPPHESHGAHDAPCEAPPDDAALARAVQRKASESIATQQAFFEEHLTPADVDRMMERLAARAELYKVFDRRRAAAPDSGLKIRFSIVEATEAGLAAALFGDAPRVFCDLAEVDGESAGFALWFYTFSTFVGRHGIYLEDLFVRPEFRGQGVGKALIRTLARRCVAENLGRFEWSVLDWNEPAIQFYRGQGAVLLDDWIMCRVEGDALQALGAAPVTDASTGE